MRIPLPLLVALVVLSLPTVIWLVPWCAAFVVAVRDAVVASRWWPQCPEVFTPEDDPTYQKRCVRGRWHARHKHHDGMYLFRDATHEFWAD